MLTPCWLFVVCLLLLSLPLLCNESLIALDRYLLLFICDCLSSFGNPFVGSCLPGILFWPLLSGTVNLSVLPLLCFARFGLVAEVLFFLFVNLPVALLVIPPFIDNGLSSFFVSFIGAFLLFLDLFSLVAGFFLFFVVYLPSFYWRGSVLIC